MKGTWLKLKNMTETEQNECDADSKADRKTVTQACVKECKEPCKEIKYDVAETFFPGTSLQWEVSFKDFLVREIGQEPRYDVTSLVANFGGTLGLMCGMSVVSILELFIWLCLSIFFTYVSYKKFMR